MRQQHEQAGHRCGRTFVTTTVASAWAFSKIQDVHDDDGVDDDPSNTALSSSLPLAVLQYPTKLAIMYANAAAGVCFRSVKTLFTSNKRLSANSVEGVVGVSKLMLLLLLLSSISPSLIVSPGIRDTIAPILLPIL
jgi:hypothetical protein